MIKVIIADDQGLFRESLRIVLEQSEDISIIAEASNGQEVLDAVVKEKPDVIVTDIQMPVMDGIELAKTLQQFYPQIRIIGLTMFGDDHLVVDMLEAGARGYLMKDTGIGRLIEAIHVVQSNGRYFCESTSMKLLKKIAASKMERPTKEDAHRFTENEKEIMRLICREYSNKEIAAEMHLGVKTIESYRNKMFEKAGVRNMAGLVVYAINSGIYKT